MLSCTHHPEFCWLGHLQEWWNATTVGEYWRLWNQPVHKWMLRHVYFPLLRHKVPKFYAGEQAVACSCAWCEVGRRVTEKARDVEAAVHDLLTFNPS